MTTTISEPAVRALPGCNRSRVDSYVRRLVATHAARRYPELAEMLIGEPLVRLAGFGDGLTTVSFRESQLPGEYMRGLLGFRLSQFLQIGLMDPELVFRRRMLHEPLSGMASGPETIHTVTLTEAGRIVGYVGLVASDDPLGLPLDSADRALFPVEVAHDVELLSGYASPGTTTHNVYEVKRFVRERSMERGPQRDRVPWHLILALGRVQLTGGLIRVVVGDSGERGALRHLRQVGFDLKVVEWTNPWLPRTELMWPSYEVSREVLAKPFAGRVPAGLGEVMDAIESGLAVPA